MRKSMIFKVFNVIVLLALSPLLVLGQLRAAFNEQLRLDSAKREFKNQLLLLDKFNLLGVDSIQVDSLHATGKFEFVQFTKNQSGNQLLFDLPQNLGTYYMQVEKTGQIEHLKGLRHNGWLKVPFREIANEITLPKKTNANQSDSEFYLQLIKQLLVRIGPQQYGEKLDFSQYRKWEKEEDPHPELALSNFRRSFVYFLYKQYHF